MLYHLLLPLSQKFTYLNVFRYITFRFFLSFVLASFLSIIIGKIFIKWIKLKQFGQIIREDGPKSHLKKSGTPTFGGVFLLGSTFVTLLLTGNFSSSPFLITIFVIFSYFLLGFLDDYLKIIKKNTKGVSAKGKLLWQFLTALAAGYYLLSNKIIDSNLYVPFMKTPVVDLGYFYIFFIALVIVGSSNAVNLTDGLDGLVTGPIITTSATLSILAYVAGHLELSQYLYIPYVDSSGELVVLLGALIGSSVGFLWYNSYPAQIFMGDVGSLSIGGGLGTVAVITKNELLFVLIGGIFVMEALSVILQVGSFKLRKKRIFKMAPIHHHFELKGWSEPKVIVRFWIISLVLSILAIATLKLR